MTNIAGVGTISYNGWTFAGPRVKSSLSIRPVRDRADRAVIHDVYSISVIAYVTDDALGQGGTGGDPKTNLIDMQTALTVDGGALRYQALGHGTFTVNVSGVDNDVSYGPKVQELSFKPVGNIGVYEVQWRVECAIKRCSTADPINQLLIGSFVALNYQVSYSVDRAGLHVRTVTGYLQIALNKNAAGGIPQSADDFREQIAVVVPPRFQRDRQDYRLSFDKATLDFTIVDRELPSDNAYPPGVVDMDMTQRVRNAQVPGGMAQSLVTINGFVETAKPFPPAIAYNRVLLIIRERVEIARGAANQSLIVVAIEISESLFGRRIDFSVTYRVMKTSLGTMLSRTGMFKPIESTNFQEWHSSLEQTAWHQRGSTRLTHNVFATDRIVTVCTSTSSFFMIDSGFDSFNSDDPGSLTAHCPPKKYSYLAWDSRFSFEADTGIIHQKPMAQPGNTIPPDEEHEYVSGEGFVGMSSGVNTTPRVISQKTGEDTILICARGKAVRAGYQIEAPKMISVLGQEIQTPLRSTKVENRVSGDLGGCKVYVGSWSVCFYIDFDNPGDFQNALNSLEEATLRTPDDDFGEKVTIAVP